MQLVVADRVAASAPMVHVGFERGRFGLEGGSCAPGEARELRGALGSLDCGRSAAAVRGDVLEVDFVLTFDVDRFGGDHGVFFDAKGGPGEPEPRLGWTEVGRFVVERGVAAPALDAGAAGPDVGVVADSGVLADAGVTRVEEPSVPDAGTDGPRSARGCELAGGEGGFGISIAMLVALLVCMRRSRRRLVDRPPSRSWNGPAAGIARPGRSGRWGGVPTS